MGLVCGTGLGLSIGGSTGPKGTTYYFSATGSDTNDGLTTATPKQTITAANALTLNAGDVIAFNGGDTFSGALVAQRSDMTYASYGTGNAIISSGVSQGCSITDLSNITVKNLTFVGGGKATTTVSGVRVRANTVRMPGIALVGLTVHEYGKHGIEISSGDNAYGTDGVVVSGCTVYDCTQGSTGGNGGTAGIYIYDQYGAAISGFGHKNATVTGCTVYNCLGMAGSTNWVGSGIVVLGTDGGKIEYCTAHDNGLNCNAIPGPSGFLIGNCRDVVIRYCESYNTKTSGTADGSGFAIDEGSVRLGVEYCYAHDNYGSGFQIYHGNDNTLFTNDSNYIRWCVSVNDGTVKGASQGVIMVDGSSGAPNPGQNSRVYNNTIYCKTAGAIAMQVGTGATGIGAYVANNVVVLAAASGKVVSVGAAAGVTMSGNLYYTTGSGTLNYNGTGYSTLAAWKTASGKESGTGLSADPQFTNAGGTTTNDYRLKAGSPCLDAGQNIAASVGGSIGTRDYYANTIGALPTNVGAYDGAGL